MKGVDAIRYQSDQLQSGLRRFLATLDKQLGQPSLSGDLRASCIALRSWAVSCMASAQPLVESVRQHEFALNEAVMRAYKARTGDDLLQVTE